MRSNSVTVKRTESEFHEHKLKLIFLTLHQLRSTSDGTLRKVGIVVREKRELLVQKQYYNSFFSVSLLHRIDISSVNTKLSLVMDAFLFTSSAEFLFSFFSFLQRTLRGFKIPSRHFTCVSTLSLCPKHTICWKASRQRENSSEFRRPKILCQASSNSSLMRHSFVDFASFSIQLISIVSEFIRKYQQCEHSVTRQRRQRL